MRFQVDIVVSANGYVEVEANSPAEAKKKIDALEPEIHFPSFTLENSDVDVSEFDGIGADIEAIHVQKMEPEE